MDDSSVNIDQQLLQAYLNAKYHLLRPALNIKIGELNPELDIFLMDNNSFNWAFITAWNPHSKPLSQEQNEERHQAFLQTLMDAKYTFCEGLGESTKDDWQAEKSLMILDIPKREAMRLGHRFEQNAILYGSLNKKAELVWLEGMNN